MALNTLKCNHLTSLHFKGLMPHHSILRTAIAISVDPNLEPQLETLLLPLQTGAEKAQTVEDRVAENLK